MNYLLHSYPFYCKREGVVLLSSLPAVGMASPASEDRIAVGVDRSINKLYIDFIAIKSSSVLEVI